MRFCTWTMLANLAARRANSEMRRSMRESASNMGFIPGREGIACPSDLSLRDDIGMVQKKSGNLVGGAGRRGGGLGITKRVAVGASDRFGVKFRLSTLEAVVIALNEAGIMAKVGWVGVMLRER